MSLGRTGSNLNIILGGMMLWWGGLGLLYLFLLHSAPAGCTATSVPLLGVCFTMWYYAAAIAVIGAGLLAWGAIERPVRAEAEDLLSTDPYTIATLSAFGSAAFVTAGWLIYVLILNWIYQLNVSNWVIGNGSYPPRDMLLLLMIMFAMLFFSTIAIHMGHLGRRQRLRDSYRRAIKKQGKTK